MTSEPIETKVFAKDDSERRKMNKIINKSYTPEEKKKRLEKIKSHMRSKYRIIN